MVKRDGNDIYEYYCLFATTSYLAYFLHTAHFSKDKFIGAPCVRLHHIFLLLPSSLSILLPFLSCCLFFPCSCYVCLHKETWVSIYSGSSSSVYTLIIARLVLYWSLKFLFWNRTWRAWILVKWAITSVVPCHALFEQK